MTSPILRYCRSNAVGIRLTAFLCGLVEPFQRRTAYSYQDNLPFLLTARLAAQLIVDGYDQEAIHALLYGMVSWISDPADPERRFLFSSRSLSS